MLVSVANTAFLAKIFTASSKRPRVKFLNANHLHFAYALRNM